MTLWQFSHNIYSIAIKWLKRNKKPDSDFLHPQNGPF